MKEEGNPFRRNLNVALRDRELEGKMVKVIHTERGDGHIVCLYEPVRNIIYVGPHFRPDEEMGDG